MRVYFDNAATTALDERVFEAMKPYWFEHFGNPSSIHTHGRESKSAVERARKDVAEHLHTSPAEILFTSGGTESDNTAIFGAVRSLGRKKVLTSPLEHHAVLHPLQFLEKQGEIELSYCQHDAKGTIDLNSVERWLQQNPKGFVSIMHGNNEIGNLNPIREIGTLCREHGALFHSDTVQTVGHFPLDLQEIPVDFIVGSAHKFHGPKGVGFLYINAENPIAPFVHGGAQERNMRGGTENVAGVVGMSTALQLACDEMEAQRAHIVSIKRYMQERLAELPGIEYNGTSATDDSLYTVLSASFPPSDLNDMLLFTFDIHHISVSGGSACSSGTDIGSHVLRSLGMSEDRAAVRFSFSKYNTKEQVDFVIDKMKEIFK